MKYKKIFIVAVFVFSLIFGSGIGTVEAADEDLAQQYAPIFYFEGGEECFPVDISYHIQNSNLKAVGEEYSDISIPGEEVNFSEISSLVSGEDLKYLYFDNELGAIDDDNIINDYKSKNLDYTIYSRVYTEGVMTYIQYWMFYAFNKGTMNQHEGDWEMVQVVLMGGTPTSAMYSQHHSGQKANWNQLEKSGDHIKVFVSRGSHANYLRSFSGVLGVANDIVGSDGKVINYDDYNIIMIESQEWLDFPGRWGWYGATDEQATEASLLGRAGPNGPKFREDGLMWDSPMSWGNNLIQADNNIFILEMILYNFVLIFIIVTIITLCVLIYRIFKRHKKTGLGPRIISLFYIDGLNLKSIGNILCIIGIIIAILSLINPWYLISTDINISGYETYGMVNMMTIDGIDGIQILIPGSSGPIPMGSVKVPFSLLIGISLVFLVIATIGIAHSKKLGSKYLFRGVKLFIPVLLIIIAVMLLNMIPFESMAETGDADIDISSVINKISSSPSGGQQIVTIPDVDGQIELKWGFGIGSIFLLISAILMIVSGGMEIVANTEFFAMKKTSELNNKEKKLDKKTPLKKESSEEEIESDENIDDK